MDTKSSKLAIDVMGSDLGIREIMLGISLAFQNQAEAPYVILVGDEAKISDLLQECNLLGNPKISIHHASQVITMDDKPTLSIKQKKDSSMMRALDLVKAGEAQAVLSCGNTGSLMAGGTIKLRMLPSIERPALSSVIPSKDHCFVLIDVGANPDSLPIHLVHNAIMGSHLCRVQLGIENPRVGLLTIGTEEGKGTEKTKQAHEHLKQINGLINYVGLIEGFHLFERNVDVVVCDGFVGNILIKTIESLFRTFKQIFKEELMKNPWRKIGAFISIGAFRSIKEQFNPDKYGMAPLIGLQGLVIKSHGSANRDAIFNAILQIVRLMELDINEQIKADAQKANRIIGFIKEELPTMAISSNE